MHQQPFIAKFITIKKMGRTFRRLVIAHFNLAAHDPSSGERIPSFAARFRVVESGDYPDGQQDYETAFIHILDRLTFKKVDMSQIEIM